MRYQFDSQGRRTHSAVFDTQGLEISATLTPYDSAHRPVQVSSRRVIRYLASSKQSPTGVRYRCGLDLRLCHVTGSNQSFPVNGF